MGRGNGFCTGIWDRSMVHLASIFKAKVYVNYSSIPYRYLKSYIGKILNMYAKILTNFSSN
jgi:hypothetical protein